MPFFTLEYVYQLGDFVTTGGNITPPNEAGAQAAGTPDFLITLSSGAAPQQIELEDSDTGFDEIGNTGQLLTSPITLDGVTYPVGTSILVNYRITDDNGFDGYSISLGVTNSGNNATTAFVTNGPLVPGQQYVFTSESNIGNGEVPYTELACFTAGSFVELKRGATDVASVRAGDIALTSNGPRPIRWVGSRTVAAIGDMAPIRIEAGTLGDHDTIDVSPNHRMLITGALAELYIGRSEILIAAKHLVNGHSIRRVPRGFVTYVHLLFDTHELITVNGCVSESFFFSEQDAASCPQTRELSTLFPDLTGTPMKLVACEGRRHEGALVAAMV